MDFDAAPPIAASEYRRSQAVIPGVEGLYRLVRAILDTSLADEARVLVVGAGGGREVEALAASPRGYRITGIDPSADMLAVAREHVSPHAVERVQLLRATVDQLPPEDRYDAATSVLIMHFFPDDGAKARFLGDIRARVETGAPLLLVDGSVDQPELLDRLRPAMYAHALLAGVPPEIAGFPAQAARDMADDGAGPKMISEPRTRALLADTGFALVAPFFRGLWFAGWWAEAV